MDSKEKVTIHACERFSERVMGIAVPEGGLKKKTLIGTSKMIVAMMDEAHPGWESQPPGAYSC